MLFMNPLFDLFLLIIIVVGFWLSLVSTLTFIQWLKLSKIDVQLSIQLKRRQLLDGSPDPKLGLRSRQRKEPTL